ncbi:MAG: hypothetical protein PHN69_06790 [Candidatus Pacebacteria bacterium]|nr:hypothetical protein [Candidatus Paceibacterota bacterium]
MSKWNYGDAYKRFPIPEDGWQFENGSFVKVHNIFDPLPDFMKQADLIFVDPPWNLRNLNTFYTKAERTDYQDNYTEFYKRLFECIKDIGPHTCYVEVGKQYLAEFIMEMKAIFKHVTFYNSMYYHNKNNMCYVIVGSKKRKKKAPLDYMDEEDIIKWICENEDYNCIGDLCMGRGLVGFHAFLNNKKFVGTELNGKRLSVLIERIYKEGQ